VRCNAGHAVDVLDLARRAPQKRIELNARVSDLVVTPDGRQAVLVLPRDGQGAIGLLDLKSYELRLIELGAEAHRVRLTVTVAPSAGATLVTRQTSFLFECFGEVARAVSATGEASKDFTKATELRRYAP
jgi:hypothetical protein